MVKIRNLKPFKPRVHHIVVQHPATGVRTDIEKIIAKFKETESVRYEEFARIWKEMNFSTIFMGRQTQNELKEFTEELFHVAVPYCLPPFELQVRVAGLYILYALYYKQLTHPKVKIRLTQAAWDHIKTFIAEIKEQHHLDVEYVYQKLMYDRAFHFVASEKQMHPGMRLDAEPSEEMSSSLQEKKSILSEIFESDSIEHLSAFHENYQQLKCKLAGDSATEPEQSLSIIQPGLVQYITRSVASHEEWRRTGHKEKKHDGGITTSESEAESDTEMASSQIGASRSAIRAKAFSTMPANTKRSRRHRQQNIFSSDEEQKPTKTSLDIAVERTIKEEIDAPNVDLGDTMRQALLNMPKLCSETDTCIIKPKAKRKSSKKEGTGSKNKQKKMQKTDKAKTKRKGNDKSAKKGSSEKILKKSKNKEENTPTKFSSGQKQDTSDKNRAKKKKLNNKDSEDSESVKSKKPRKTKKSNAQEVDIKKEKENPSP